jgi:hypothetical protein
LERFPVVSRYHNQTDERKRDVGLHFEKAHVLLCNNFRYFGRNGTADYKEAFKTIKALIESLTQGHRVNHSAKLRDELLELKPLKPLGSHCAVLLPLGRLIVNRGSTFKPYRPFHWLSNVNLMFRHDAVSDDVDPTEGLVLAEDAEEDLLLEVPELERPVHDPRDAVIESERRVRRRLEPWFAHPTLLRVENATSRRFLTEDFR